MSRHTVFDNRFISEDIYTIAVEKGDIIFEPGACASINGRTYSFASSPNEDKLRFYIRRIKNGSVSDVLHELAIGDTLDIDEVHQYFFPGKGCENIPYVYIATGTGLAPFISALKYYKHKPVYTLFGTRTEADSYIATGIWSNKNNIVSTVSRENISKHKRVTELLPDIPYGSDVRYFLCGNESMISEVSNHLINKGIEFSQISTEQFFY